MVRDDEDWVGTPPEGRHSRDRADPEFWHRQRPPLSILALGVGLFIIAALIVALLT
jgi:hypothetical protein